MKKISLSFLLVLTTLLSIGQNPVTKPPGTPNYTFSGNEQTLQQFMGYWKAKKGLINGIYTDTTQANLGYIDAYAGAQIFTTTDTSLWLRNTTATKWIRSGGAVDISSFTFITDSSIRICFGNGVCDTFPVNNLTNIVNNIVQNFIDSSIVKINDTTLLVCSGNNVCDTIHLGNSNTYNVFFDSTTNQFFIVTCDTLQAICVTGTSIGDSCYTQQVCDTILIPKPPTTVYQNLLWKNGPIVEVGDPIFGVQAQMLHDTYFNLGYNQLTIQGVATLRPPLSVFQGQWSQLSPSIQKWRHYGKYPPTDLLDGNNPVSVYMNYTDPFMVPQTGGLAGDTLGYLGIGEYGYMLMTNGQGRQANLLVDDYNAKQVGMAMYTYGTSNKGIGFFVNQLPSAYNYGNNPAADSTLDDAMVLMLKTTGQIQFPKYITNAFPITNPVHIIAQDANGNLFQYPPGGLGGGGGGGLLFARDDARNNSGGAMYFSAATQNFWLDSLGYFVVGVNPLNGVNFYDYTTGTNRLGLNSSLSSIASPSGNTVINWFNDSLAFNQPAGNYSIYNLPQRTDTSANKVMVWNATTKKMGWSYYYSGTITGDNAITMSTPTNAQLGGTLLHSTTIATTNSFNLTVSGGNGVATLLGTNSGSGTGVYASSVSGTAFLGESGTTSALFRTTTALTNTTQEVIDIIHNSSGTAVAGFGLEINLALSSATIFERTANQIKSIWTDPIDLSRTSKFIITGVNNAILADLFTLSGNGETRLNKYGVGTFTAGTATYLAAYKSDGTLMEFPTGGLPGGGALITADNGLTATTATNVQLGAASSGSASPLLHTTYINTTSSYHLEVIGNNTSILEGSLMTTNNGNGTSLYVQTYGGSSAPANAYPMRVDGYFSSTNTVEPILQIMRSGSGGADGIGGAIEFRARTAANLNNSGTTTVTNRIASKWVTVGSTSQMDIIGALGSNILMSAHSDGVVGIGISSSYTATRLNVVDNGVAGASIMKLTSTSTAAAGNLQKGIDVSMSGANATAGQQTWAGYFSNTHGGSGGYNVGVNGFASGAQNNYGVYGNASGSGTVVGVYGESVSSTGRSIWGIMSSGGTAIYADGQSGSLPFHAINTSSITNTVQEVARLSSVGAGGSTITAGIGGSLDFYTATNSAVPTVRLSNQVISKYTDVTDGARTSQMDITGIFTGTTNTIMSAYGSGVVGIGISSSYTATRLNVVDNAVGANNIVNVTSTSTAAASNLQKGINVDLSGANSTASQFTYGIYSSNTHTGTGANNIGVYGTASGGGNANYGIYGNGTTSGVYGESTNSYGGYFTSTNGGALIGIAAGAGNGVGGESVTGLGGRFVVRPSSTNTVVEVARLNRQSSGTGAAGIGGSLSFYNQDDNSGAGYETFANDIQSSFTVVTHTAATSKLNFRGVTAGSVQSWLTIGQSGYVQFRPMTVTEAGALATAEGLMVFVSNTDATFTSIGLWIYQNGAWKAL